MNEQIAQLRAKLLDENGKPTAVFWILVSAIVVGLFFMIAALANSEEQSNMSLAQPLQIVPDEGAQNGYKPARAKKPEAASK